MLDTILKAGFFICVLGFLSCWLIGFLLGAAQFPKSMQRGWRFNEKRKAGTLKPGDFELKSSDKRFLNRYFGVWFAGVAFLLGAIVLWRFRL
ncbi:MAG: hypothetical protein EPO51_09725 [Phenylobacterium sp.]|uniref:hypothetical protein n=1 Tax=Phenylobacterium sp. TaxID=1871053 RepID=UPI0012100F25|nr:hypothetical protein [Phenylobacterium sp.]TAJ72373.1 MAG: hypothetical protein EPO51_09725 [Phenylobacterium sp.]